MLTPLKKIIAVGVHRHQPFRDPQSAISNP